jgi:hypothetical protein
MSVTRDLPSVALGALLAQALDRSIETSLASHDNLRTAVRSYARHQRDCGRSLDSIMRSLAAVLMELEDDRADEDRFRRDPHLARQLRAWCSERYSEPG